MIAPHDCVEKTAAESAQEAFKLLAKKVPNVTNHAPQIKNSRNIIIDSFIRIVVFIDYWLVYIFCF